VHSRCTVLEKGVTAHETFRRELCCCLSAAEGDRLEIGAPMFMQFVSDTIDKFGLVFAAKGLLVPLTYCALEGNEAGARRFRSGLLRIAGSS
jgi:hypothetical protein